MSMRMSITERKIQAQKRKQLQSLSRTSTKLLRRFPRNDKINRIKNKDKKLFVKKVRELLEQAKDIKKMDEISANILAEKVQYLAIGVGALEDPTCPHSPITGCPFHCNAFPLLPDCMECHFKRFFTIIQECSPEL